MRVLHILDSLNRGGAEVMMLDVCRRARESGLDLTFVATGGGEMEEEFRASGVDYIRLQRRYPVDFGLIARLRRLMRERQISVVHSHQAVEALHAYFATQGTRTRRVLTLHGWIPTTKNRVASRFVIPRMHANITVSRDLLDYLSREERIKTGRRFHVLYNGVDARRLLASAGPGLRAELGLDERHVLAGMVSNFYLGLKDQLTVCKALPKVFEEAPWLHFVFAGGRSESAPRLYDDCVAFCRERGISERVHFLGRRADVPRVLDALDLFVFSSLQEGSPIAVIEAMMRGLPGIVSDIPPLMEATGGGLCAVPFRTRDPLDLSRAMAELVQHPQKRRELGERARAWANANFSIETHLANLLALYNSLMGVPSSGA